MPNFDKIKIDGTPYLVHDTQTATALSAETQARQQAIQRLEGDLSKITSGKIYYCSNNNVSITGENLQTLLNKVEDGSTIVFDGFQPYSSLTAFTINKPLTLTSTCPYLDLAFIVASNYVTFKNIKFNCNNSQYPVTVRVGRYLAIENCRFTDCVCAIRSATQNGVAGGSNNDSLWHQRGCWKISGCIFEGCQYGIMADYSTAADDPTPTENRWMRNNDWTIVDCIFNFCSKHSVYIRGIDGLILQGNTFFSGQTSGGSYTEYHVNIVDRANYVIIDANQFFESGSWSIRSNYCDQLKISNNNFAWPGSNVQAGAILLVNPPVGGYSGYVPAEILNNRFQGGSNHIVYLQYPNMSVRLTGNTFSYAKPPKFTGSMPATIFAVLSAVYNLHQAGNEYVGMKCKCYSNDEYQGDMTNIVTTAVVKMTANTETAILPALNPFAGHCTIVAYNNAENPVNGQDIIVHDLTVSRPGGSTVGTAAVLLDHGQAARDGAVTIEYTRIDNSGRIVAKASASATFKFIAYWTGYHRIDFLRVYDNPVD